MVEDDLGGKVSGHRFLWSDERSGKVKIHLVAQSTHRRF